MGADADGAVAASRFRKPLIDQPSLIQFEGYGAEDQAFQETELVLFCRCELPLQRLAV